MTTATFTNVLNMDLDVIYGMFPGDVGLANTRTPCCYTVTVSCDRTLTQQEMDDITALATAKFILVEFS